MNSNPPTDTIKPSNRIKMKICAIGLKWKYLAMLNFDKVIDKIKPLYIIVGKLKSYSHFEKLFKFLKKKNMNWLYEPATLMFGNLPKRNENVSIQWFIHKCP